MANNDDIEADHLPPLRDEPDDLPTHPVRIRQVRLRPGLFIGPIILLLAFVGLLALGGIRRVQSRTDRMVIQGNFSQIIFAVELFHDAHGRFPANTFDANGQPLLSWRVQLLPYIEGEELYQKFHFDEPWDSPNNRPLLDEMPHIFGSPNARSATERENRTFIRAFSTQGAAMERIPLERGQKRPNGRIRLDLGFNEVLDVRSETIFMIEAGESVEWTKPDDLTWDIGQPIPSLGGDRNTNEFQAAFVDGKARTLKKSITPGQLKALITIAGGEPVRIEDLIK
ncbi:DUF1559 family PulG-like putative transporter [Zavarzinella formosa]|uniref:DUF1559 family PulG-like putative transporter n=1 Tax=Zavarzinella formosa TaxID=360055 RepID=UPI000377C418|nr:DUF1559 domain-containing protein [Zavarzinella formosa]